MADPRKTAKAEPSTEVPGHFLIACDDGSQVISRDYIDGPDGIRIEISAADGGLSGDGPLLTDEVRAELEAFGQNIPAHTAAPKEYVEAIAAEPSPAAPVPDTPQPSPISLNAGLVLSPEEHQETKTLAQRIEACIPEYLRREWLELRALLGHL